MHRAAGDGRGARAGEVIGDADDRPADDGRGADGPHGRPIEPTLGEPDRALGGRQPQPVDELRLLVRPQEQVDRREALARADRGPSRGRRSRS